jgi:hypothetical protein
VGSRREHFCAFCSLSYRSYNQRHAGWKEFLLSSVFSMVLMWAIWKDVHIYGFILWGALLAMSEIVLRVRWRSAIRCPHCAFDPVLYKTSPEAAAKVVKEFLEHRKKDPSYLLRPQPILPVRRVARDHKQRPKQAEM